MKSVVAAVSLWLATLGAALAQSPPPATAVATFAGGCFWCVEADFDKVPGVISTTSGYTGGHVANPTYMDVSAGITGHTEAVKIVYDPAKVSYAQLLDVFWHNHDPLTANAQFCDHGSQYRAGIYTHDDDQKQIAEASLKKVAAQLKGAIVTEITAAGPFYAAEDYHQDYHLKNPLRYSFYRFNCGRDSRLEQVWGKAKADKGS